MYLHRYVANQRTFEQQHFIQHLNYINTILYSSLTYSSYSTIIGPSPHYTLISYTVTMNSTNKSDTVWFAGIVRDRESREPNIGH